MTTFRALQKTATVIVALLAVLACSAASASASAVTVEPWWHVVSLARPSYLPPEGKGVIVLTAINVGDADANGEASPIRISDVLPEHVKARSIEANTLNGGAIERGSIRCELGTLTCTFEEGCRPTECPFERAILPPFDQIEVVIGVELEPGASSGEVNRVHVSGGGAPPVQVSHAIVVSAQPTPFGAQLYEETLEEVGGAPATQAGTHPFQFTTTLDLNEAAQRGQETEPAGALPKDLTFKLPAGLVGNPTAYPNCSLAQFGSETCSADTAVGVAVITYDGSGVGGTLFNVQIPVYNLEPSRGEPARFGFFAPGAPVFLDTSVRTGEDYGVTVHVHNIPQTVDFLSNTVTFWGVPGAAVHDDVRGAGCFSELAGDKAEEIERQGGCKPLRDSNPAPLLSMPTSCTGPLRDSIEVDSWAEPQNKLAYPSEPGEAPLDGTMQALDGCSLLPFSAEVGASADEDTASSPSGLKVDVHVPQAEGLTAVGLAAADVKSTTVALPEGVVLNPSAADGLQACSLLTGRRPAQEAQEEKGEIEGIDLETKQPANCPNASKVATVTIHTPLLPNPLKGFIYLAAPQNFLGGALENPFKSLVALYLVAEDPVSGTLVKFPMKVTLSETGQIVTTVESPQLPFEDAEFEFFGGERAPLATPTRCGSYTTNALFEPWTTTEADPESLHSSSAFGIAAGPNGSACPGASLPFSPTLESESTNIDAGGLTPLSTTLSRESGQQDIQSVTLHYPPGLSGLLSGVSLCPEAQANAGTCPESSRIGETIVSVGVGGAPFTVTGGKVYITEKYDGAPFGLSITNPAKAGPFDLQEGRPVVVRAKVEVNPETAALTIATDASGPHAIPTIIEGFPLQIQHVNVLVDRPGFTFNPTDCNPTEITGTIDSAEGASYPVKVPFQVTNCAVLKFEPKFQVSTSSKTSRTNGASLAVNLTYPKAPSGSQANIRQVKVELPKQLPSRLTTLQKACTAAQFHANPAGCPAASLVGHAKAITPLVPVPLEGPAYFVSNGGEAFPNLIVVLQGYGVTIDLVGDTFISKAGITSSTFKTVPDAPVGSFELTLPEGKFSALTALGNLCKQKLVMPTEFVAQNGAEIHQNTKIAVTGCGKAVRHERKRKHTKKKKKK